VRLSPEIRLVVGVFAVGKAGTEAPHSDAIESGVRPGSQSMAKAQVDTLETGETSLDRSKHRADSRSYNLLTRGAMEP